MDPFHYTGITVWRTTIPLRFAFSHNLATRSEVETLVVRLDTSMGVSGYGQVLPRSYLTGETIEGAIKDIRERWWPRLQVMRPRFSMWRMTLQQMYWEADKNRLNASYAGVEMAAWDAWARIGGSRVREGGGVQLVGAIPALGARKAYWLARILWRLGYRRFKVKLGQDGRKDDKRLAAVRDAVGKGAWLSVDANAAWGWDEAVERMHRLSEYEVALVEEPLRREVSVEADYTRLEKEGGIQVMVDESLCTEKDAESLLARGSPSWWNVRIGKNGGFSGYMSLAELALINGIHLYGGILVGETGVMAAAARQAWSWLPPVCGEYGFSRVFLRGDPFRGSPSGYRGWMGLSTPGTGLGVSLKEGRLGLPIWTETAE